MAYETIETIANAAARPSGVDGMIRYQQDIQSCIVYDGTATAWKVFTPDEAPYDLDGTNIVSTTPLYHLDAGFMNGVDASGNPSDGVSVTGPWMSKTKGAGCQPSASSGYRPVWTASGTNSKPYLLLTGDIMPTYGPQSSMELSGEFTIMLIGNKITSDTTGHISTGVSADVATPSSVWFNFSNNGGDYLYFSRTGADNDENRPTINLNNSGGGSAEMTYVTTRLFMITRDGSNNTDLWVDGNNQNTSLDGQYTGDIKVVQPVGGNYPHSGHLYETALWDSNLSTADRNKVIAYVNTKYGSGKGHNGSEDLTRADF